MAQREKKYGRMLRTVLRRTRFEHHREVCMPSSERQVSNRDIFIIGLFIGSVCFVTLTPAMYLAFHALQWKSALRVIELAFPPAFLLAIAACLLVYQRARLRREL